MSEKAKNTGYQENRPDEKSPKANEILVAAESLLSREGYDGLSAQAVADEAGVNKALIFYYWGSTQALFDRVLERFYVRHKADLKTAFGEPTSLETRLHGVVDTLFDTMGHDPIYPRIVQQQVSTRGSHYHLVERHLGEIQQWLLAFLGPIAPASGPLSIRHFHLSFSAVIINFFTYGDAFFLKGENALEERRAHVHWLVNCWVEGLKKEGILRDNSKDLP